MHLETDSSQSLDVAVLFVDLVGSSDFASVLGLREYASYVESFEQLCEQQCRYFFDVVHAGHYQHGRDYHWTMIGDELVVFLHTGRAPDDIYQLMCLAIMLKCGWLGLDTNAKRIAEGMGVAELGAGIHIGRVWATWNGEKFDLRGHAINLAKRIESASRQGDRYHILVSATAFKRVRRRLRNIIFSRQQITPMKGIVLPMGMHEVADSFVDISKRLAPQFLDGFQRIARQAIEANALAMWIHSCLMVYEEATAGSVSDELLTLCENMLHVAPDSPVALWYAAQAMDERNEFEFAVAYLEDLTQHWPQFADGWLQLGKMLERIGDRDGARRAAIRARQHGIRESQCS